MKMKKCCLKLSTCKILNALKFILIEFWSKIDASDIEIAKFVT